MEKRHALFWLHGRSWPYAWKLRTYRPPGRAHERWVFAAPKGWPKRLLGGHVFVMHDEGHGWRLAFDESPIALPGGWPRATRFRRAAYFLPRYACLLLRDEHREGRFEGRGLRLERGPIEPRGAPSKGSAH